MNKKMTSALLAAAVTSVFSVQALAAGPSGPSGSTCSSLSAVSAALQGALTTAATALRTAPGGNKSFGLPFWATLVDDSGKVCAVTKESGSDPWLGSRVISAQKANTANAFSTGNVAISTANLYSAVQPGGSLYGLQHSNPVNTLVAYRGDVSKFGTGTTDPMVGLRIGGINVFGGGVALYNASGQKIGAVGVSGDTSCADHYVAWEIRKALLGTGGVSTPIGGVGLDNTDNIIYDITPDPGVSNGVSLGGWGHAGCAKGNPTPDAPAPI